MIVSCQYFVKCVVLWMFFFKQKTAYEMRISDWSSDVCSSDLAGDGARAGLAPAPQVADQPGVVDRDPPELGGRHIRLPQKPLDLAQHRHLQTPFRLGCCSLNVPHFPTCLGKILSLCWRLGTGRSAGCAGTPGSLAWVGHRNRTVCG